MRRYAVSRDPYWITVKYPCRCAKCGADVPKGERAFYYPSSRGVYGKTCGCAEQASNDFHAAVADESAYGAGYGV